MKSFSAITFDDVMDRSLTNVTRCDLCPYIAEGHVRYADISAQQRKKCFVCNSLVV